MTESHVYTSILPSRPKLRLLFAACQPRRAWEFHQQNLRFIQQSEEWIYPSAISPGNGKHSIIEIYIYIQYIYIEIHIIYIYIYIHCKSSFRMSLQLSAVFRCQLMLDYPLGYPMKHPTARPPSSEPRAAYPAPGSSSS